MQTYTPEKKPAFFPFVSAEIFFEADAQAESGAIKIETLDESLDTELDDLLRVK